MTLTAIQAAIPLSGSAVLGYMLVKKHITPQEAFSAALIEELYQAQHWGDDEEAAAKRAELLAGLEAIAGFVS